MTIAIANTSFIDLCCCDASQEIIDHLERKTFRNLLLVCKAIYFTHIDFYYKSLCSSGFFLSTTKSPEMTWRTYHLTVLLPGQAHLLKRLSKI